MKGDIILIYTIIFLTALFGLIILFELIAYLKHKKKIFNCIGRNTSKKFRKQLTSDIELLYEEIKFLSPKTFRKLKFTIRSSEDNTFISRMVSVELTTLAILIAITAMVITCVVAVNPNLAVPVLESMMNYSTVLVISIALMSLALVIHLKIDESTKSLLKKFNVVIEEIEKEQPITVRLSEDQYRVLSTSSGLRRNVYRFGRSENL